MENNDAPQAHLLFTDGSSLGNPGPGGWGTVLVLSGGRVMEMGGATVHTTNNRMELFALIEGLKRMQNEPGDITVFTDSKYVHKGATEWAPGWKRRNWVTMAKTPVENRDLWEEALTLLEHRKKVGHVAWTHVPGHSGIAGNERCDEIATGFATSVRTKGELPLLYEGDLADYVVDILNITIALGAREKRSASRAHGRAKAYSYLSLVDGKLMRHLTWGECEQRVKGKSGVKFKKTLSRLDEERVASSWGVRL